MSEAVLRAEGLGKRYRRRWVPAGWVPAGWVPAEWALSGCTLTIEPGHVTGLVGRNGAGKTTLLSIAAGLRRPSSGMIEVCGHRPGGSAAQRAEVGYVAQEAPTYGSLTVGEHLRLGKKLNPMWDGVLAEQRIRRLGLDENRRAAKLSGGQRAQLALTIGLAKRPKLLILDEPAASLDPVARRDFFQALMEAVAEQEVSVILSSHLVSDLERVCDHVVVLVDSEVRLAGEVDEVLATHRRVTGPRRSDPPPGLVALQAHHSDRQSSFVVRGSAPVLDPAWAVGALGLEDVVLAYLEGPQAVPERLEVVR
jgi:ABC-2 type transport system ATP-binding protein